MLRKIVPKCLCLKISIRETAIEGSDLNGLHRFTESVKSIDLRLNFSADLPFKCHLFLVKSKEKRKD